MPEVKITEKEIKMKNVEAAELRLAYEKGVRELADVKNVAIVKANADFKEAVKALRIKIYHEKD